MIRRAGIVVTGTEVLTGRVSDRNGPWLAEQLRVAGVDVAHVVVVGDRPADLRSALGFLAGSGVDLILTSGGLGPTADDLTADVVADFQGRPMRLEPDLEQRIAAVVADFSARRGVTADPVATADAVRKQARVPQGSVALDPVGTAPGLVVPPAVGRAGPPVVVLPGPPGELQGMWPAALADPHVQAAIADRTELRQRTLRLYGTLESDLAATLRANEFALTGLEITTCLRDAELEIVTRYGPAAQDGYDEFASVIAHAYPDALFSPDGRTVDEIVGARLTSAGLTVATGESCTAGLLAGRLTARPGSSAYVLGGVVAYSNAAKSDLLDVPADLIVRVGAVSREVAEAMAMGARRRLRADIGIGVTGIAGPGGGTPDKPVGLVQLCAADARGALHHRVELRGSRADIRSRAVVLALHLLRQRLD